MSPTQIMKRAEKARAYAKRYHASMTPEQKARKAMRQARWKAANHDIVNAGSKAFYIRHKVKLGEKRRNKYASSPAERERCHAAVTRHRLRHPKRRAQRDREYKTRIRHLAMQQLLNHIKQPEKHKIMSETKTVQTPTSSGVQLAPADQASEEQPILAGFRLAIEKMNSGMETYLCGARELVAISLRFPTPNFKTFLDWVIDYNRTAPLSVPLWRVNMALKAGQGRFPVALVFNPSRGAVVLRRRDYDLKLIEKCMAEEMPLAIEMPNGGWSIVQAKLDELTTEQAMQLFGDRNIRALPEQYRWCDDRRRRRLEMAIKELPNEKKAWRIVDGKAFISVPGIFPVETLDQMKRECLASQKKAEKRASNKSKAA